MIEPKTRVLADQNGHTLRIIDNEFYTLQADRDALAAQVVAQQVLLKCWQTWLGSSRESCDDSGAKLWDKIEESCSANPQHHLATNDAEVAKAAFIAGACSFDKDSDLYMGAIEYSAERYAASLKK